MKSYKFAYYILLPTTLASSSLVPSFLCSSNWKNFSMETSKRDFWVSLILVLTYTLCALIAFAQGFFEFLYLNYQILKLVSPFKSCYISENYSTMNISMHKSQYQCFKKTFRMNMMGPRTYWVKKNIQKCWF